MASSTTSSDTVDVKKPDSSPTQAAAPKTPNKSIFSRATSKLRTAICFSHGAAKSSETPESQSRDGKDGRAGKDGKAGVAKDATAPEDQTMKTEFKHLDRKYDSEDKPYFVERKKDETEKGDKKDWWQLFAFCVVRRYDSDGDLDETCLYVNPQPLRQLLKDVIGDYPLDPINVDDVQIASPYHSLFHYHKKLEEVGLKRFEDQGDSQSAQQLKLLLEWVRTNFELEIAAYDRCVSSDTKAIVYDKLWTLFMPGTIVHSKVQNQHRAFRVTSYWYDSDDEEEQNFNLSCKYVDYDGEDFGHRTLVLSLRKYTGMRAINSQGIAPLQFISNASEIRAQLLARGTRFRDLAAGQHFMQYKGIGFKPHPQYPGKFIRFDANGRVMIDCKTYHRIDANDAFWIDEAIKRDEEGAALWSDQDLIVASATVRGYSMTAKRFVDLSLEDVSPIEWNSGCFDSLVLDAGTKKTVQALVTTHSQRRAPKSADSGKKDEFDDIVKGKGQGLVCVLHGPPGVGKTLTAECVAEYVQRPLFMVSSGDLGTSSEQLDTQLTEIMDMASTWRAVLLIDEADIFLEQRALHDLHRNAMVSVFLRVLEYYAGILFLTTNRVATFDDAFKSRIHIPIRYTDLDATSRLQIWRSFAGKVPGGVEISEDEYEALAAHDLNGRQIKNIIKAAESLAAFDKVKLDYRQLKQVTKIQAKFDNDLASFGDIDYTAPGSARKDAESRNMYC